jgi:nucleoside-diphosphate-sugar epimerase
MRLLITGGAGFIGSNLALMFANRPGWRVITFDNLRRCGSELALARLQDRGIAFIHGDVRNSEDLEQLPAVDQIFLGTFNCLEYARRHGTAVVFLSTSCVITDRDKVSRATGRRPARSVAMILDEVLDWLDRHRGVLETILA